MAERPAICEDFRTDATVAHHVTQQSTKAPTGSFLIGSNMLALRASRDPRPRVPVNPETGLAYPLILPPKRFADRWTRHHHNFPEAYLGGHGLRHVYVQKAYARLHNEGPGSIHEQFSIPESLPEQANEQRSAFTLGLAAHIPHEGLDLFSGDPKVRCMTRAEEERLITPGIWGLTTIQKDLSTVPAIHMRWRAAARRRLPTKEEISPAHHFISQILLEFLPHIDGYNRQSRIFETTSHPEVGFDMLRAASRLLVESTVYCGENLADKYRREQQRGRLRADSPAECDDLLIGALGTRGGLGVVFSKMKAKIGQEADATPVESGVLVA